MYVRHAAWLAATPDKLPEDRTGVVQRSRLESLRRGWANARRGRKEDDYQPDMPPLFGTEYLIGYLYELGPVMAGAMGAGPVTHMEIQAWMAVTGVDLQTWEVRFLRTLSNEYLSESHKATERTRQPPWNPNKVLTLQVGDDTRDRIRALASSR